MLDTPNVKRVIIVGGGFAGLNCAQCVRYFSKRWSSLTGIREQRSIGLALDVKTVACL